MIFVVTHRLVAQSHTVLQHALPAVHAAPSARHDPPDEPLVAELPVVPVEPEPPVLLDDVPTPSMFRFKVAPELHALESDDTQLPAGVNVLPLASKGQKATVSSMAGDAPDAAGKNAEPRSTS